MDSAAVDRKELQHAVRDAIGSLGEEDQAVVVLRGIEQLSNNKVAEILGVQASTITVRYQKALQRLRTALPVENGFARRSLPPATIWSRRARVSDPHRR